MEPGTPISNIAELKAAEEKWSALLEQHAAELKAAEEKWSALSAQRAAKQNRTRAESRNFQLKTIEVKHPVVDVSLMQKLNSLRDRLPESALGGSVHISLSSWIKTVKNGGVLSQVELLRIDWLSQILLTEPALPVPVQPPIELPPPPSEPPLSELPPPPPSEPPPPIGDDLMKKLNFLRDMSESALGSRFRTLVKANGTASRQTPGRSEMENDMGRVLHEKISSWVKTVETGGTISRVQLGIIEKLCCDTKPALAQPASPSEKPLQKPPLWHESYQQFADICSQLKSMLLANSLYEGIDAARLDCLLLPEKVRLENGRAYTRDVDVILKRASEVVDSAEAKLVKVRSDRMHAVNYYGKSTHARFTNLLKYDQLKPTVTRVRHLLVKLHQHIEKKRLLIRKCRDRDIIEDELAALKLLKNEFAVKKVDLKELSLASDAHEEFERTHPKILSAKTLIVNTVRLRDDFVSSYDRYAWKSSGPVLAGSNPDMQVCLCKLRRIARNADGEWGALYFCTCNPSKYVPPTVRQDTIYERPGQPIMLGGWALGL